MDAPFLTVGMPTFDDHDGTYFSIQALRKYQKPLDRVQLLLVDNKPDSPASPHLKRLLGVAGQGCHSAKYVAAPGPGGPALAKDRVVREADGKYVLCMDSHVLLEPNAIQRLIEYYEAHPDTPDLLTGPLEYDSMANISTHFVDFWRGEMWGIWGSAWEAPDGRRFSVLEDNGRVRAVTLTTNHQELDLGLGHIPFYGHEHQLTAAGCRQLGLDPDDEFEIPGQGMGLFSVRKDAWPGFNPDFRGFGGEEMYMHEKVRQRGGRAMCLGFLRWLHRFGHPNGVKYPLTRWNKVRNYVLGHRELGLELTRVYDHFVAPGLFSEADWEFLIADPVTHINPPGHRPAPPAPLKASGDPPPAIETPAQLADMAFREPGRDLNQHIPKLTELASQCDHVTDISERRESVIGLAAGNPGRLISYNTDWNHGLVRLLQTMAPNATIMELPHNSPKPLDINPTDLLFIDTRHSGEMLLEDLRHYSRVVRRWIARHDTQTYLGTGPDGKAGFHWAIRTFLDENPDWFVAYHTGKQHGLTVLGKRPEDRPPKVIHIGPPGFGPGTELRKMLESIGVNAAPGCDCKARQAQMDIWGVEECRNHREEIIGWMRDGQGRWGWAAKIKAAALAVQTGLAFKLNPADPFPTLIDEAIRRAEKAPPRNDPPK
jgi:hypothetical protein